jgi:hypothetical protein
MKDPLYFYTEIQKALFKAHSHKDEKVVYPEKRLSNELKKLKKILFEKYRAGVSDNEKFIYVNAQKELIEEMIEFLDHKVRPPEDDE